jgi:ATP synthase protein I
MGLVPWEIGVAVNEPSQDPDLPEDARLTSLDKRLKQAQLDEAARTGKTKTVSNVGRSQGMRILSDLIGIPFGCGLIGWLLDGWLDTRPWVMLALLFLGFGIAVRNVLWISKQRPE